MTLVLIVVAGVIGYMLGRRSDTDTTPDFKKDPEFAHDMADKGHGVVEAKIAKRKARIMETAKAKGRITNDDVEDLFCISDATARNYLNELEHESKLSQVGEGGRGVYYTPK